MLGRTNTGGGGSGGLNFQVIGGTTAPSNPKENMIWVNTSTKITSYVFSATQPTGSAGMVWITTAASSTVAFNALKKNGIQVYPISAKQYVSGKWVNKTAKSWQGGEWVDWWNGELFDNGDQVTYITGGFVQADYTLQNGDNTRGGTMSVGTTIKLVSNSGANSVSFRTKNKIDLSKWSKLRVNATLSGNANRIFIHTGTSGAESTATIVCVPSTDAVIDISSLTGSYYVGGYSRNGGRLTITKLRLER